MGLLQTLIEQAPIAKAAQGKGQAVGELLAGLGLGPKGG
jgi:hypothetical protein